MRYPQHCFSDKTLGIKSPLYFKKNLSKYNGGMT